MTTTNNDANAALSLWLETVASELNCDLTGLDVSALLDVARDVAHHQIRPGAPTSTFVVGMALGAWEQERVAAGSAPTAQERAEKLVALCGQVQKLATAESGQ